MTTPQSYKFTLDSQKEMVALMLQSPEALPRLHGSVKAEYFSDYHLGVITREILSYYGTYGQVPNPNHIKDRLTTLAGVEKAQGVLTALDEICKIGIKNPVNNFVINARAGVADRDPCIIALGQVRMTTC